MPKISIVVPVYNTEYYLRECLDSILSQTFQDFEVLLVNDGSKDKSGEICDEYVQRDSRFKVIHKQNEGVSAARNDAIDEAKGEFIGFIDSDDFVSCKMYERFVQIAESEKADIIMSEAPIDNNISTSIPCLYKYDNKQARFEFFKVGKVRPSLWLGIFKRTLFQSVRFPENIHHWEDFAFIAVLVSRSSKVVVTNERFYYYRVREGSATQSPLNPKQLSSLLIYDYLDKHNVFSNDQERYNVKAMFITGLCRTYVLFSPTKEYKGIIRKEILSNLGSILKASSIANNRKLTMLMFCLSPFLASRFALYYHNRILSKSVNK